MLIEKEVIAPGRYFYIDEKTGQPRTLDVDSTLTKHWHSEGSKMLSAGLAIPVPYEHDFSAHPMTPKDKLLNNAGEVKKYELRDILKGDPLYDPKRGELKDVLFSTVDIQDSAVKNKIGSSIRWTSPWFNSFTDGDGKQWNNVIAHLALTTRPRITKQSPFPSTQAALSIATHCEANLIRQSLPQEGMCLSRAGALKDNTPIYPMAFSLFSGVALGEFPPAKGKKPPTKAAPSKDAPPKKEGPPTVPPEGASEGDDAPPGSAPGDETQADPGEGIPALGDQPGDVSMEEVLCDLLRALGVDCEHSGDEGQFKRNLYTAAMQKVHELTNKGMNNDEKVKPGAVNKGNPPGAQPIGQGGQVQQEQQPMYMSHTMSTAFSLEEIEKLPDPLKGVALAMYGDNERLRASLEANQKTTDSLKAAKITEASTQRSARVSLLSRISPKIKTDLEAMVAAPSMALSLGDGGTVIDPMANTLSMLEKQLSGLPELLRTESTALAVQPHPTDSNEMTDEESDRIADILVKRTDISPVQKKAG